MNFFKKLTVTFLLFLFPVFLIKWILKFLGVHVGKNVKIGFSIIYTDSLIIGDNVNIKHFNLIKVHNIDLHNNVLIGFFNRITGPFNILMCSKAAIGKFNVITRAKKGISSGNSILSLGILTKINSNHFLDLTKSIKFGDYSSLAGLRSQLWTHGYVHVFEKGPERFRVDGSIEIGDNVYIGSNSFFNPGVKVSNDIHIGGNSNVSKDLTQAGMYVSQGLRWIKRDSRTIRSSLIRDNDSNLVEEVFKKIKDIE